MREQISGADGLRDARREARKPKKASPQIVLPSPNMPMAVAREFVKERCQCDGVLTVHHWRGTWWQWRRSHWAEIENREFGALLYTFTENACYIDAEGNQAPWAPNRKKIGDLLDALAAITILAADIDQPSWLDGRTTGTIVAVANGLLEVETRHLLPHSPQFFNQCSVPFDYDKDAPEPKHWYDFLDALWPDEPTAVDVLGEWFGYVISGRLDLHKIFCMVGPTRGGKGVIARIETALIGKHNVCGPTLSSLGGEFGLAPLLGKSLAIISDARSGGGKNSPAVVERLLSISGEDTLTVNRKYRDQWSGKLPVRLHVISNELPRLGDASSAIVGRLVLLLTTRSWLGKEDYQLETNLRAELSGILNWSLDGLQRLTGDNENHFTRFTAAEEAITIMRDLASPVGAFVREKCVLDPEAEIEVDVLYTAYKNWCQVYEYPKSDKARFGRDLRAASPSVKRARPRDGTSRHYVYAGIRQRMAEDETEQEEAEEELPLSGYNDALGPRTTRTKTAAQPSGRPSGPSGPRDKDIVEPTKDGPGPARERDQATYGLSQERIRELAAQRREWFALADDDEMKPEDVDDAIRFVIREEIGDQSQVEIEFARVMRQSGGD
jgi:putative DNA primase/helicase